MAILGIGKKKKTLGFEAKHRTTKEIDEEYTHHAALYGHISRSIKQFLEQNESLLDHHMDAMFKLNKERMALPPEMPPQENQPA